MLNQRSKIATTDGLEVEDGVIQNTPAAQKNSAKVTGTWDCADGQYEVTLSATVKDRMGNSSVPYEFTLQCGENIGAIATYQPSVGEVQPTLDASLLPTQTPANTREPTKAPTVTKLPPTATLQSGLPTFSQVLATYPSGVDLCVTEADVLGGGDSGLSLNGTIAIVDSQFLYQCYGTKLTLTVPITLDGVTYPVGALLTVDKNLKWVQVSSWQ